MSEKDSRPLLAEVPAAEPPAIHAVSYTTSELDEDLRPHLAEVPTEEPAPAAAPADPSSPLHLRAQALYASGVRADLAAVQALAEAARQGRHPILKAHAQHCNRCEKDAPCSIVSLAEWVGGLTIPFATYAVFIGLTVSHRSGAALSRSSSSNARYRQRSSSRPRSLSSGAGQPRHAPLTAAPVQGYAAFTGLTASHRSGAALSRSSSSNARHGRRCSSRPSGLSSGAGQPRHALLTAAPV